MYLYYSVSFEKPIIRNTLSIRNATSSNLFTPDIPQDRPKQTVQVVEQKSSTTVPVLEEKPKQAVQVLEQKQKTAIKSEQKPVEKHVKLGLEERLNTPVETVTRTSVAPARVYTRVSELAVQKREAETKQEIIEINRQIRKIQEQPYRSRTCTMHNKFFDLETNVLGKTYVSETKQDKEGEIFIGDVRFVKDARFHFVLSNSKIPMLRTTAYLTQEGIECLERFIKKYYKTSNIIMTSGGRESKKNRKSNLDIRRYVQSRNTHDFKIAGADAHLNLKGRIEIFASDPRIERMLVDYKGLTNHQRNLIMKYSKHSQLKAWIKRTTTDFNIFIGRAFSTLAKVVDEIYSRYSEETVFVVPNEEKAKEQIPANSVSQP